MGPSTAQYHHHYQQLVTDGHHTVHTHWTHCRDKRVKNCCMDHLMRRRRQELLNQLLVYLQCRNTVYKVTWREKHCKCLCILIVYWHGDLADVPLCMLLCTQCFYTSIPVAGRSSILLVLYTTVPYTQYVMYLDRVLRGVINFPWSRFSRNTSGLYDIVDINSWYWGQLSYPVAAIYRSHDPEWYAIERPNTGIRVE